MKPEQIKTADPFKSLFPINSQVLDRVQEDMQKHGYDTSQPLIIWAAQGVVVDGHTRLEAAKNIGLEEVPVHEKNFADADEALAYAIHNQSNRRNLTDNEILQCIEALDRFKARGGGHKSDAFKEKSKASNGAIDPKEKSAQKTAKLVGVSRAKVERARAILTDRQAAAEVRAGKKKISRAYQEIQNKREGQHQPEPAKNQEDGRLAILQKALIKIRPWREKYKDYPELSGIFQAIDDCQLNLERLEMLPKAEEGTHAGVKLEPCFPVSVEKDRRKPQYPGAFNNGLSGHPNAVDSTDEPVPSSHENGAPEPEGQAASPVTSARGEIHQRMCGDCRKFTAATDGTGLKGTCEKYPQFTWAGNPVCCPYFEPKDTPADANNPLPGVPRNMEVGQMVNAVG